MYILWPEAGYFGIVVGQALLKTTVYRREDEMQARVLREEASIRLARSATAKVSSCRQSPRMSRFPQPGWRLPMFWQSERVC